MVRLFHLLMKENQVISIIWLKKYKLFDAHNYENHGPYIYQPLKRQSQHVTYFRRLYKSFWSVFDKQCGLRSDRCCERSNRSSTLFASKHQLMFTNMQQTFALVLQGQIICLCMYWGVMALADNNSASFQYFTHFFDFAFMMCQLYSTQKAL